MGSFDFDKNDKDAVEKKIQSLGTWFQHIDLGNGLKTITKGRKVGYDPTETRWKYIEPYVPNDLTGKSVLDLGCNAGFYSLQMAKRGADRIVGVDPFQEHIDQTQFISDWFNFQIELIKQDAHVYCLSTMERFDYIIFLGVFYHLKYGTIVLDRLAEMVKEKIYFQTHSFNYNFDTISRSKIKSKLFSSKNQSDSQNYFIPQQEYTGNEGIKQIVSNVEFPKMYFIENKFNGDITNWWFTNDSCAEGLLRSSGLEIIAKPYHNHYVCKPKKNLGKKVYDKKLVFPVIESKEGVLLPL